MPRFLWILFWTSGLLSFIGNILNLLSLIANHTEAVIKAKGSYIIIIYIETAFNIFDALTSFYFYAIESFVKKLWVVLNF